MHGLSNWHTRYAEDVANLSCFCGISALTAISLVTEVGDFNRFPNANSFVSFLGLSLGEDSSGENTERTGITKAGNKHLRRLLVESANSVARRRRKIEDAESEAGWATGADRGLR